MSAQTRRAARAFEAFKGEKPTTVRRSRLPDNDVTGYEMGPVVGIAYEARRDGKTQPYFHEFKKSARPKLVAQDDGRQLYIEGGRYKVTDRGIEDRPMPDFLIVNPSARSGRAKAKKGTSMAQRRRRRRSSHVSVFTTNPRRRRSSTARRSFARNPAPRRRRRSRARSFRRNPMTAARRVYRRNPSRRRSRSSVRRYRRNPSGGGALRLANLVMPAVFIGLGGVASEILTGYLPIPAAWKTGPTRYLVKAGVGIAAGLILAKVFKQKKAGYYFAAGAIVLAVHDFTKALIVQNASGVKGLNGFGYVSSGQVTKLGQYSRPLRPGLGQYSRSLRSPFGGDASIPGARQPGGEMPFAA